MVSNLRNPETQAKLSGVLLGSAVVILLVAAGIAFQKFDWTLRSFVYSTAGIRMPIVMGTAFLSLVLAGGAFWFAYASAGERRNSYSRMSWICFAISALTIVLGLVFMAAYKFMAWVIAGK